MQAGVAKLNEAKEMVDKLKQKAAHQSKLLAEKQEEADVALKEITASMQVNMSICSFTICDISRYSLYTYLYREPANKEMRWKQSGKNLLKSHIN